MIALLPRRGLAQILALIVILALSAAFAAPTVAFPHLTLPPNGEV